MNLNKKCCLIECANPVKKDSKVNACNEHEQEIIQMYEEEHEAYQKELYDDWEAECTSNCYEGVRQYYANRS